MSEAFVRVDCQHLEQLHQAIGDDFYPLIPAYIEQSDHIIDNLNNSYREQDMEVFVRSAHSLKSSSHTLGAFQLSEYSRQLEESALAHASNQLLEQLMAMINTEYPNVKQALLAYLNDPIF